MVAEIETHEGALANENVANDTSLQDFLTLLDIFLWLPTGFGKLVCYEGLPLLFNFARSKSGSIVLRWTELLLGLHTYCGKPSPSSIGTNSSRLRHPGKSSFSPFWLNNEDDQFRDTSDKQTLHVQSLMKATLIAVH